MDILLIFSPMPLNREHYLASTDSEFPMGLCYLGAVLEHAGHRPDIFDCQLMKDFRKELALKLKSKKYNAVGFSAVTPAVKSTNLMASIIKDIDPETPTIIGGAHPTVTGPSVLDQMPDIDMAVFSEAEMTLPALLEQLEKNKPLEQVPGIAFRKDNKIWNTGPRELIKNLDVIPFPAHHLIDINDYSPPPGYFFRKPIIPMVSSRGCPFDCAFCADTIIWQGKSRLRSAKNVVDEMEHLKDRYGAREIKFYDDTFTVNRKRTVAICEELLIRDLNLLWRCASRVDTVDFELLQLMKESGCGSISFGIESGDENILERMNKKITLDQVKKSVRWAKDAGIETKGFFMLNYPGENTTTTERTIRFSKELDLDFVGFNITVPFYGTRLYDEVKKTYRLDEKWDDTDALIGNQIYFYQDNLPEEYLKKAFKRATRNFYLQPKIILRKLKNIKNLKILKSYIAGLFRLFRLKIKE